MLAFRSPIGTQMSLALFEVQPDAAAGQQAGQQQATSAMPVVEQEHGDNGGDLEDLSLSVGLEIADLSQMLGQLENFVGCWDLSIEDAAKKVGCSVNVAKDLCTRFKIKSRDKTKKTAFPGNRMVYRREVLY